LRMTKSLCNAHLSQDLHRETYAVALQWALLRDVPEADGARSGAITNTADLSSARSTRTARVFE
jgi:hypothetical protein